MTIDLPLCPICGNRIKIYHMEEPTLSHDTIQYNNVCGCTTCNVVIQNQSTITVDALKNEEHMEKIWQITDMRLVNDWNRMVNK